MSAKKTYPIASVIEVESPRWCGRMVVEDVTETYGSTTYTLVSLDGVPPLGLGMLGRDGRN